MQRTFIARTCAVALSTCVSVGSAYAADIVNTAIPSGGLLGSNTVDTSNWLAEKFSVASATQIDSIMTYVMSADAGTDLGRTFTVALYANSASNLPALDWWQPNQDQLFQSTVTYHGDGWNGVSGLNWNLNPGSYWLALEVSDTATSMTSLQAPTGALPTAQAVAYYVGGQGYVSGSLSDTFGLHITSVTPAVPEPSGWLLAVTSLAVIGGVARRRH